MADSPFSAAGNSEGAIEVFQNLKSSALSPNETTFNLLIESHKEAEQSQGKTWLLTFPEPSVNLSALLSGRS